MKKVLFGALALSLAFVSCKKENASEKIDETAAQATEHVNNAVPANVDTTITGDAVAKFDKTEHDFGDLKKGSLGETEFTVTNEGKSDLVITEAKASCGCTVPEYPKAPIKPGESAKIKVVFNANSVGVQNKTVTVKANTQTGQELLRIKANVTE